jgi:hypothetical protein
MANVLIADDARSWYESGSVRDVLIQNNIFNQCGTYAIDVLPEAYGKPGGAVHKNIRVINNRIILKQNKQIRVKRTEGFVFKGNIIEGEFKRRMKIVDCTKADIEQ